MKNEKFKMAFGKGCVVRSSPTFLILNF